MNNCLRSSDFAELGTSAVKEFQRRVHNLSDDLCAPFHDEARCLETEILSFYKVAALHAKRADNLDQVASVWQTMARICDDAAKEIEALHKKHPECGAGSYRDKLIDLRNKCLRLQQMHQ